MGLVNYTVYSEAGGTYKTTVTANNARAHADQGLDVLVIDLDHQKGNISRLLDVAGDQDNSDADNLVMHMLDRPRGSFDELVRTSAEGIDVIPAHNKLEDLKDMVVKKELLEQDIADGDSDFNRYSLLRDVLKRNDVSEQYDVVMVDPNARAELSLYNALYATGSVVAPVEFGGKGTLSVDGLEELGAAMAATLDVSLGVVAIVPNNTSGTKIQQERRVEIEEKGYEMPVVIGERESLMKEMWNANGSAFKVIEEGWYNDERGERTEREREQETLAKIRTLADYIAEQFDVDYEPVAAPEVTV